MLGRPTAGQRWRFETTRALGRDVTRPKEAAYGRVVEESRIFAARHARHRPALSHLIGSFGAPLGESARE